MDRAGDAAGQGQGQLGPAAALVFVFVFAVVSAEATRVPIAAQMHKETSSKLPAAFLRVRVGLPIRGNIALHCYKVQAAKGLSTRTRIIHTYM